MRTISQIRAFEDDGEVFEMPAVRIIGVERRSGGKLGNQAHLLWNDVLEGDVHAALLALPTVVPDALFGWMCDPDPSDGSYRYILGAMTPAGTPVPPGTGFVALDVPAGLCFKGQYSDELTDTVAQAGEMGYDADWTPFTWNAELFIGAEDEQADDSNLMPRHWIIPVRKKANA